MLSMYSPGAAFGWEADDGHCCLTPARWLMVVRGLSALLEEDTDASRAALREWLPQFRESRIVLGFNRTMSPRLPWSQKCNRKESD